MQIPILSGIYTDSDSEVRTAYPVNKIPVIGPNGVSNGHMRPGDGLVEAGTGPNSDRGGINWNDLHYRVMGSKLVSIDSSDVLTEIGDVENDFKTVSFAYSFTGLAIISNLKYWFYDGTTLTEVTDPNVGDALDVIWIDGYFMLTDGEFVYITDLNDPTLINTTKYASAEVDPDPLRGLIKVRNEAHAVGRFTIEIFRNTGASGFPFARVTGGHIEKGSVGTHSICEYKDTMVFVGGGVNEQISVHQGVNGRADRIASREIDEVLQNYTESELAETVVEYRNDRSSDLIYIHLPDQTLVYDPLASQAAGTPVWCILSSSLIGMSQYRAKNMVYVYNRWYFGDPTSNKWGYFTNSVSTHFGSHVRWELTTPIIYNDGNGATIDELELVAMTGAVALGDDPTVYSSYSLDGIGFSQEIPKKAGKLGERRKRLAWRRLGKMKSFRIQRFRGDSSAHMSILRLEARMTPTNR